MKIFKLKARLAVAFPLFMLAGGTVAAQVSSTGAPTGINKAFVKLFGAVGPFTAKVETQVFDADQKQTVRMPMEFAVLDGKVRIEINFAQIQSKDLSASVIQGLKQSGMDRVISIFRPDKKVTYALYPSIQSYLSVPLPKAEADVSEKSLKLEKTALGKETIDGHACIKNKTVVKDGQGPPFEAVTWNATDLKGFPVQIEIKDKKGVARMLFTQIQFAKLDASQFDLPATYSPMK